MPRRHWCYFLGNYQLQTALFAVSLPYRCRLLVVKRLNA